MYQGGERREQHLPRPPLTARQKGVVLVFFLVFLLVVAGVVTLVIVETRHATECGGAITNTPNAPKPTPPPGQA